MRILDANLNRAREALRTIEDYARFARDDAAAANRAKHARHALPTVATEIGPETLLAARDILNDVGRDTKTAAELDRATLTDVARAAFGRLGEAARSISEVAKLFSREAAATAETLRYDAYELEQTLLLRGDLRARFRAVRLYVIITAALCRDDWLATAAAAIRGGATCLQLREKTFADAELLARASALRRICSEAGCLLIINDSPDIAKLCHADGVHLGQDDLPVREARTIAGPRLLIGKSTHTVEQVKAAIEEQPDYIAVGPMYATATKDFFKKPPAVTPPSMSSTSSMPSTPSTAPALTPPPPGPEFLQAARALTDLPLVAIGGINAANAAPLIAAGANCICACSAIISNDSEPAARNLKELWGTDS